VLRGSIGYKTQLNDALIESYEAEKRTLDNLLEGDRGLPEIGCKGESSILDSLGKIMDPSIFKEAQ
jgi:hypothetical protein